MNIIEKLRALRTKPEWDDQDRLALVLAMSSFMQDLHNGGVPFGAPGLPNMQTLIEVGFLGYGEMPADDLARCREQLLQVVEIELLPFLVKRDTGYHGIDEALADYQPTAHPLERFALMASNFATFAIVTLIVLSIARRVIEVARARAGA